MQTAGEEVDVVSHLALGRYRGKFVHVTPDGAATLIEVPNAYGDLSLDHRTVILKILGGIDQRPERAWESFVVSEDDHIDYLAQAEITVVLPVTLAARAAPEPLPLPRLSAPRVEPAGVPPPGLGP